MVEDCPMLFVTCSTDELIVFKNKKGEVVLGSYDVIVRGHYVLCVTQREFATPDEEYEGKTGGWVVVDWSRGQV